MRVVITSLGSMGDVQPFVALADELRRHGHQSIFALPAHLLPYATRRGFDAIQLGPDDLSEIYQRAARAAEHGEATEEGAEYYAALIAAAPEAFQALHQLCTNTDLLISSVIMPIGRIVHDYTGIPFVSVQTHNPEEEVAMPEELNMLRTQLGLPPVLDPKLHGVSPQLMLIGISPVLLSVDYSWPEHVHVTGFLLPEETDWQPDPALETFMKTGPAPVVITMGSIMHDDPARLTKILLTALEDGDWRAVIQHGWTGLASNLPQGDRVYAIDYVPHSWLFPHASCIVHHGGGGTTAAALRAGVPTVVIPSNAGVLPWARRADALGCAGAMIPYAELSAERLRVAITNTLNNPYYRQTAMELGTTMRREQGVQMAYRLIEEFMTSVSTT